MITTLAKNSKEHLCDTCSKIYPDCSYAADIAGDVQEIEFGDGVGRDNIISCNTYVPKEVSPCQK